MQIDIPSNYDTLKHVYINALKDIEFFKEQLRLANAMNFGKKSDQVPMSQHQLGLFNEAEKTAPSEQDEAPTTTVKPHERKKPKREQIDPRIPRVEHRYDLSEEEKKCPHDGTPLKLMGEEVSEQLDIIPAKIFVDRHVRLKYSCPCCKEFVITAPMPPQPIPKSNASPGLLTYIAISKYQDALPLYRQEAIFRRLGLDLRRQTIASWMIKLTDLLMPIINLLHEHLIEGDVIQCDETRVLVLKKTGQESAHQGYMWVLGRWSAEERTVLFFYEPSRAGAVPVKLLSGFKGYLQVDGYDGYNAVSAQKGVKRVGCLAHVRRKFVEAIKAAPPEAQAEHTAHEAVKLIKDVYEIESKLKDVTPDVRQERRQTEVKPALDKLKAWLDKKSGTIPPRGKYGEALSYALSEWENVIRYLEHPWLRPDNNLVENAIRPFAIGRKNWLFSDTENGANASAAIYSIIESAKANGHEPFPYLRYIIEQMPRCKTADEIERLLPYKIKPEEIKFLQ